MKKILLLLVLFALAFTLTGCVDSWFSGTESSGSTKPDPEEIPCAHEYVELERIEPMPLKDGEAKSECSLCHDIKIDSVPMTRELKILTIGNSFGDNSLHYLWGICDSAGMEDAVFGNANIGGASLDNHASSILLNSNNYSYLKYTKAGMGDEQTNMRLEDILADEEWDYIAIQQLGHYEGLPNKYGQLEMILDYVIEKCPDAEIHWYMTWAYQQDSTHSGFAMHNNDQMTMYNAIVETVQSTIVTNPRIKGVIPCGTAMQNFRTSCYGDNVTKDGYHAKPGIAKYLLSLTWFEYFTGGSFSDVKNWFPAGNNDGVPLRTEIILYFDAAVEAVENALENPFEITESTYTDPIA